MYLIESLLPMKLLQFLSQSVHPNQIWELEVSHSKMRASAFVNKSRQMVVLPANILFLICLTPYLWP